jgi:hypothetical protein
LSASLVWLSAVVALPILGAPLLSHRACRAFQAPCRIVLSGAVGGVLLSFTMTAAALVDLRWNAPALILVSLLLSAALRWTLRGEAAGVELLPPTAAAETASGVFAAAAVAIALVSTIAGAAASPDLLLFWGPKASAFAAARTIDTAFLAGPSAAWMHPYYPPLATNLYAFATLWAGSFPWTAAALTLPILLAALAAALPPLLRSAAGPGTAAAVSALVVSVLALIATEADAAGNADALLWLYEILGLALLLGPRPTARAVLLLAGLLLAGAATTKVEALPFVLAAALGGAAGQLTRSGRIRAFSTLVAPTALALGSWLLLGRLRHAFTGYGEYGSLLELRLDRAGPVLRQVGQALGGCAGGLPFLVPAAVAMFCLPRLRPLPLLAAGALALFLGTTYLLPVADPSLWIEWSAARTLAPVTALVALSVADEDGRRRAKTAAATSRETREIAAPSRNERGA